MRFKSFLPSTWVERLRVRLGQEHHFRFVAILYGGSLVIMGIFAFAVFMPLASHPTFCGKACHNMAPEWETWKRSSHAQITCYACHGSRSYLQFFREKLLVDPVGAVKSIANAYEKPINAKSHLSQEGITMDRCERCHSNENRKFTFSRGIYMNHLAHKQAGINCTVCHNRITHKGAEKYEPLASWEEAEGFKYKNFLTMKEGCFRCHSASPESRDRETLEHIKNGKKPPQACSTCHTKDFGLPAGHGVSSWRTKHGERALENIAYCMSCHSEKAKFSNGKEPWCTLCHDREKVQQLIGRAWKDENE